MTVRPIRVWGDAGLRHACEAVTDFDAALGRLVDDLEDTVRLPGRAGLAANQIGVGRRVFAYDVDGQVGHVVNPVVEALEGEQSGDEGCLSLPGLWYLTTRAAHARVTGVDRHGEAVVVEGEGLMARCLQHEVDHLDGHLFLDRLSAPLRRKALRTIEDRVPGA